jgi:uncharacterized protein DUF3168
MAARGAIFEALSDLIKMDLALAGLDDVWDEVPFEAEYPYAEISEIMCVPNDLKDEVLSDYTITLGIWTKESRRVEVNGFLDSLKELIHRQPLAVGDKTATMGWLSDRVISEPSDPLVRHAVARFEIRFL